jgi:hypothetical protein
VTIVVHRDPGSTMNTKNHNEHEDDLLLLRLIFMAAPFGVDIVTIVVHRVVRDPGSTMNTKNHPDSYRGTRRSFLFLTVAAIDFREKLRQERHPMHQ